MEKLSEIIASGLDEVIKLYDPVINSLSDKQRRELENFKKCKLILSNKIRD